MIDINKFEKSANEIIANVKKCVAEILDSLCDRNGFDDWWYNLDNDIKLEIEKELEEIIKRNTHAR